MMYQTLFLAPIQKKKWSGYTKLLNALLEKITCTIPYRVFDKNFSLDQIGSGRAMGEPLHI